MKQQRLKNTDPTKVEINSKPVQPPFLIKVYPEQIGCKVGKLSEWVGWVPAITLFDDDSKVIDSIPFKNKDVLIEIPSHKDSYHIIPLDMQISNKPEIKTPAKCRFRHVDYITDDGKIGAFPY